MDTESSIALLSKGKHASISPEKLEMMGKEAANVFISKGISLNETLSKLAAAHDDINQEQIKRVCEFANTAVYLAKHDMSKTAGHSSSYPEFDLADPNRVIQDLSDGTKSTVTSKTDATYSRLPLKEKTSSVVSPKEKAFEEMFKAKTAEDLDFSKDTIVSEVMTAKESLNDLKSHLSASGEQLDMLFKEASEEFYELSKRFMMDGGSFSDINKVANDVSSDGDDIELLLQPIIKRLVKEKVSSVQDLKQQMREMKKLAHRTLNPEHPMMKVASTILTTNRELEKIAQGLSDVEQGLVEVNTFIREQLRAE